ncbi:VanZ family protein [Lentilactobacillus senioris]|uniref:VanZ family protein n=1 Tax=Lentilactobacillus senioris TaxID=931534 RepID=UPI00228003F4|nr:VanZ family protein [Lentilactobacillus senioris]
MCVWWLIFTPGTYFGSPESYHSHYIYFNTAKIIYLPAGILTKGAFFNVIMTVPAGVYLALIFPKHLAWYHILLIAFLIGGFNEVTQFILDILIHINRTVDVTDVLTNLVGVLVGYGMIVMVRKDN